MQVSSVFFCYTEYNGTRMPLGGSRSSLFACPVPRVPAIQSECAGSHPSSDFVECPARQNSNVNGILVKITSTGSLDLVSLRHLRKRQVNAKNIDIFRGFVCSLVPICEEKSMTRRPQKRRTATSLPNCFAPSCKDSSNNGERLVQTGTGN